MSRPLALALLLFATLLICDPSPPPVAATIDPTADSDGDGVLDVSDPQPLLADTDTLRWRIDNMRVEWDAALLESELAKVLSRDTSEQQSLTRFMLTETVQAYAKMDATTTVSASVSANPIKAALSADVSLSSSLSASAGVEMSSDVLREREQRLTRRRLQERIRSQLKRKSLSAPHLAFELVFGNNGATDIHVRHPEIPIYLGGEFIVHARYAGPAPADGHLVVPAGRAVCVLAFRAELDTDRLVRMLDRLSRGAPQAALDRGQLKLVPAGGGMDVLRQRAQIARRTVAVTVAGPRGRIRWRVARQTAGRSVTLAEALRAITARTGGSVPAFTLDGDRLTAIAGEAPGADLRWRLTRADETLDPGALDDVALTADCTLTRVARADLTNDLHRWLGVDPSLRPQLARRRGAIWRAAAGWGWPVARVLAAEAALISGDPDAAPAARASLTSLAEGGSVPARLAHAERLLASAPGAAEVDRALAWIRAAAVAGDALAQLRMGELCYAGRWLPRDLAAARGWFDKAHAQGNGRAGVARVVVDVWSQYQGREDAVELFGEACRRLEPLARAGSAEAQYQLGQMYLWGLRVARLTEHGDDALRWTWRAAHQGHVPAQLALAEMLEHKVVIREPQPELAATWYRHAASAGSGRAWLRLALRRMRAKDRQGAELLYLEAAATGDVDGILTAARVFTSRDLNRARRLYDQAAETGDVRAQIQRAWFYVNVLYPRTGKGHLAAAPETRAMFEQAARHETPMAIEALIGYHRKHRNTRAVRPLYPRLIKALERFASGDRRAAARLSQLLARPPRDSGIRADVAAARRWARLSETLPRHVEPLPQ